MFFISFLFYFSGNYKPQLLFFVQGNKITFVLQSKANEQGCEGGTAKPLPLSLAKLCSSCGGRRLRATQRLLRSEANEERDGDDFRGA